MDTLVQHLEMFIENVRQMGIIVSDFQPQGQNVLNQKMHNVVSGMQEIDRCKSSVQDIHVPLEVFEYIDQGKNPQLYTKDCIERAVAKNEQAKGKIDTFRKFKGQLVQELSKTFPEEMDRYKSLKGTDEKQLNS